MSYVENGYTKLESFRANGYVVLDAYDQSADPAEWADIVFVDWKSSGETRFAPLASVHDTECEPALTSIAPVGVGPAPRPSTVAVHQPPPPAMTMIFPVAPPPAVEALENPQAPRPVQASR